MIRKMLNVLLLSIIGIMIFPTLVKAETIIKDWSNSYGGAENENFWSIKATSDGGYVTVGTSRSTNVAVNGSNDAIIVKYNSSQNIEWQKVFGGYLREEFYSVTTTSDGGYVAVGFSTSENVITNGLMDGVIIKYSSNGNVLWQKVFGGSGNDCFYSVIPTSDGGYIAVGYSNSSSIVTTNGGKDAIIVKYSSSGNVEWQQAYGGNLEEEYKSVTPASDGGYVAVGISNSSAITSGGGFTSIIVKYNNNGEIDWQKTYGGDGTDYFNSVIATSDGGYVAVGNYDYDIGSIVKYSNNGTILWHKLLDNDLGFIEYRSVIATSDGYLVIGRTDCPGIAINGERDALIVKYNDNGELKWKSVYGGNADDNFFGIDKINDDSFIMSGKSKSSNLAPGGEEDGIIVKYNITYDASISEMLNGMITLSKMTDIDSGELIALTINPASDYKLKNVKILKKSDSSNITSTVGYNNVNKTFAMPSYDVEVDVEFEKISHVITKKSTMNGSFTVDKTTATSGTIVEIMDIISANSYRLKNVKILKKDDSSDITSIVGYNNANKTFIMPSYDVEIELEFEKTYIISTNTTNGSFAVDKTITTNGSIVEITDIIPANNYRLKNIKILKKSDSSDITSIVGYNNVNKTFIMPNYDVEIDVEFEKLPTVLIEKNPQTGDRLIILLLIAVISIIGIEKCKLFFKKNYN